MNDFYIFQNIYVNDFLYLNKGKMVQCVKKLYGDAHVSCPQNIVVTLLIKKNIKKDAQVSMDNVSPMTKKQPQQSTDGVQNCRTHNVGL